MKGGYNQSIGGEGGEEGKGKGKGRTREKGREENEGNGRRREGKWAKKGKGSDGKEIKLVATVYTPGYLSW